MNWESVADVAAAVCMLTGALLSLIAAIGVVRLPDLLTRMHAATKPQVLGLLLVLLGLALSFRDWQVLGLLFLVGLFQLVTSPIANHMVGRAALRADQINHDLLVIDEFENSDTSEPRGAP